MEQDRQLTQLLARLADAIRKVPAGDVHDDLAHRFFAVISHLDSKGIVQPGNWTA